MAHVKYFSPSGWDFGQPAVTPIKYGSRGLIGNDRTEFLKRASHVFLPFLDNIKIAKDEIPVHLIGLGADEFYGGNRNGDAFSEKECRDNHDTFVKLAKFFKDHKNKPERGDPHYGVVKYSAYNEDMKRVELLCLLNAEKSAAERNGGLVAESALQKLAKTGSFDVSMACRVPFDECSYCGNKAPSREQYCTTEKCAAGGCRDNLARVVKVANDLHHLRVLNHRPAFMDISEVFRGADRIAKGSLADYLTKAASDEGIIEAQYTLKTASDNAPLSAILYQSGSVGHWSEKHVALIKLGYALAALEKSLDYDDASAYHAVPYEAFPVEKLAQYGTDDCDKQLAALAERNIILGLTDFARLTKQDAHVKSAAAVVPFIYTKMMDDESLQQRVERGACEFIDKQSNDRSRMLAAAAYEGHSLAKHAAQTRVFQRCIRGLSLPGVRGVEKFASCDRDGEELARNYAIYKLAALWRTAATDKDYPLTVRLSLRQNRVL